ncbi:glycosyltransferase [Methanococcus maripaludis]|uniref:Glycosyltransferase involved in cell wall biosynthesis n=1 Tax=Methanococcus maripaludis TaxID=39152 RepID=A0A7J9PQP3_METMI|nr:glycosyltransferase [Methanococcus maripaludis]MBA2868484.1 glycosyltransferase involved in cell wall biosynthesis [Methanococcus maripaludis]
MNKLKEKTLLILTPCYPGNDKKFVGDPFVKYPINEMKRFFKEIIVISPQPYFPSILSKFKFFRNRFTDSNVFQDYYYENVNVFYPKFFTLPITHFRIRNGDYCYKAAKRIIKKNNLNFDLVHAHFTWPCGYVAVKLKEDYKKKVVLTGHGFDVYELPFRNKFWNKKITDILKKVDKIITVSESNKKYLKVLGFNSIVLPNGFTPKKFKFFKNKNGLKSELNIPLNKKIILHVGNLVKVKNQLNLINATNELQKKRKDFILYLIGGGPDEEKIITKIKELRLEDHVKVLGSKPHDEIPLWMNVADLFVLPSYSEGNPTVMFEALGCGLPYIGTNVGGVSEIITSEEYGLIYNNPDDYYILTELINKGLDKKWNSKKIIDYSKEFTWKKISKHILKTYSDMV